MNALTDKIAMLIDILERTEALHTQLLPIMDREKSAALGSDPKLLAAVVVEKQALLSQLALIEKQRQKIIAQIAEAVHIPASQLNLSALSQKAAESQKSRIVQLKEALRTLFKTIKQKNEENRELVKHCLAISRNTLGFFQHWMMPASVYGASGRISDRQHNGKLLSGTV